MENDFSGYFKQEPTAIVYYCVNENITSIEEFMGIEEIALNIAVSKRYNLFKVYDVGSFDFVVCKN
jgi:hypothetical protein